MIDLIIVGAGGHGRTLHETATFFGYENIIFLDDNASLSGNAHFRIFGKISDLKLHASAAKNILIGIGNNKVRELLHV